MKWHQVVTVTCERQLGSQRHLMDDDTPWDLLQLLEPQTEDWHCLVSVLTVSSKHMHDTFEYRRAFNCGCARLYKYNYIMHKIFDYKNSFPAGDLEMSVWSNVKRPWYSWIFQVSS